MAKRVVARAPRIVGKPLAGPPGSPEWERAEKAKEEIQTALRQLIEGHDQLAEDVEDLDLAINSGNSQLGLHPFFLGGM